MTTNPDATIPVTVRIRDVFERQLPTSLRLRSSTADERIAKIKKLRDAVLAHTDASYAGLGIHYSL